jgi:sulfatase maturation enzyme AslB (radical SAM superfamily)
MDSFANIYSCHILNERIGNLATSTWDELWNSPAADRARDIAAHCDKCWLVCTGKAQIWEHKWPVGVAIMRDKFRSHTRRG